MAPKKAKVDKWANWGIPGLELGLTEALAPFEAQDGEETSLLVTKVQSRIMKASTKFEKDPRGEERKNHDTQARALVEEFIDHCLGSIDSVMHDKTFALSVDWGVPLLCATLHTFKKQKAFVRVLAPRIEVYVQDGINKHKEEDRILKVMFEALELAGVKETHMKKANSALTKAYDEAFSKAPYGDHADAATPELAMLQDFVKGWMTEFMRKAWDVMDNGLAQEPGEGDDDSKVFFITVLFQTLTDPGTAVVPMRLLERLGELPDTPWAFVGETAATAYNALEAEYAPAPKAEKGSAGKGFGKFQAKGAGKEPRGSLKRKEPPVEEEELPVEEDEEAPVIDFDEGLITFNPDVF